MTLYLLLGYGLSAALALAKYLWDRRHPTLTRLVLTPRNPMQTMTTDQTDPITTQGQDAAGLVGPLPTGTQVTYALADPTMGSLAPAVDTLSVVLTPSKLGNVVVNATATVGGKQIGGTITITVTPGAPVSLVMSAGIPTP